jgi:hypothetical protein
MSEFHFNAFFLRQTLQQTEQWKSEETHASSSERVREAFERNTALDGLRLLLDRSMKGSVALL